MYYQTERVRTYASALVVLVIIGSVCPAFSQTRKKRPVYYSVYPNHVMHVRLNDDLDSEKARVGDTFSSTLVDPIYSKGGVLLVPQGSSVNG